MKDQRIDDFQSIAHKFEKLVKKFIISEHDYRVFEGFEIPASTFQPIDYYISSPIRAFIEFKYTTRTDAFQSEKDRERVFHIKASFSELILPIVIYVREAGKTPKDVDHDDMLVIYEKQIDVESNPDATAKKCAKKIADYIKSGNYPLSETNKVNFKQTDFDKQFEFNWYQLQEHVFNFETVIDDKNFAVLLMECGQIDDEYAMQHYESAVLRCGRALEHIIYCLSRAWGVEIEKTVAKTIQTIKQNIESINKEYVNLHSIDKKEPKYFNSLNKFYDSISLVTQNLDELKKTLTIENKDLPNEKTPIFLNSIIRSIIKKYKNKETENKKAVEELNKLVEEENPLLDELIKQRNKAAHANIEGDYYEVSNSEFIVIYKKFVQIIFILSNVAALSSQMNN